MAILILTSLSLLAVGIFFIPEIVLAGMICAFFLLSVIIAPKKIPALLKQLLFLLVFLIPLFIIKSLVYSDGLIIRIGFISVYYEGMINGAVSSLRVFALFCAVFFTLKVMFPLEKYKDKYSKIRALAIVFWALEMFPEMTGAVGQVIKERRANNARGIGSLLDGLYRKGMETPKKNDVNSE
jgi:hypothetical protein